MKATNTRKQVDQLIVFAGLLLDDLLTERFGDIKLPVIQICLNTVAQV